jgi:hypothetical protein
MSTACHDRRVPEIIRINVTRQFDGIEPEQAQIAMPNTSAANCG